MARRTLEERKAAMSAKSDEPKVKKTTTVKEPKVEEQPIVSDEPAYDESNPLLQEVVQRDYAKSGFRVVGGDTPDSVPIPRIERPIIDLNEGSETDLGQSGNNKSPMDDSGRFGGGGFNNASASESGSGDFRNPSFDNMKPKAQKESARKMAKTIVDAYQNLNNVIRDNIVKTDINKLQMKAIKGEFDMDALNVELPISESETVTIGEVIEGTNSSANEIFTCSEEFNEETEELWTEILKEKGLGMSPIQRLTWLYVEDLGKKGIAAWGIYKTNKELLNTAMSILSMHKNPQAPRATEYVPHNPPTAQQEPQQPANNESDQPETSSQSSKPSKKTSKKADVIVVEELHEVGETNKAEGGV